MDQASFHCPHCNQQRLFQSQPLNHILYLLISVLLCGLGFIIWIIVAASHKPVWHCSFCGYSAEARYLVNPQLQQIEQAQRQQQRDAAAERERSRAERLATLPRSTFKEKIIVLFYTYQWPSVAGLSVIAFMGLFSVLLYVDSLKTRSRDSLSNSTTNQSKVTNIEAEATNRAVNLALARAANSLALAANQPANMGTPASNSNANVSRPVQATPKKARQAEIIADNANLRLDSDQYGEIVDILPVGTVVDVVRQKGPWFYVRHGYQSGWVHGNTIEIR